MSKLILFLADGSTQEVPLDRERTTIGRRADNDICLPNVAVSGAHAAVVTILSDSFLEDLGSTNGTLVNGTAIVKHFLRDRDEIDVGRHKLIYCVDDDAVMEAKIITGIARVNARDFGERVEMAKPIVQAERPKNSATGRRDVASASTAATPVVTPAKRRAQPQPSVVQTTPPPPSQSIAFVKLLSGPNAGRDLAITKSETTIGRPGVQVALICQSGATFHLKPIEGDVPPIVNGQPATGENLALASGDVIEIAGAKLEFVLPRKD